MKHIGVFLEKARTASGLSRMEVAEMTGLARCTLWQIETGTRDPTFDTVRRICAAIGLNLDDLDKKLGKVSLEKPAPRKPRGRPAIVD